MFVVMPPKTSRQHGENSAHCEPHPPNIAHYLTRSRRAERHLVTSIFHHRGHFATGFISYPIFVRAEITSHRV